MIRDWSAFSNVGKTVKQRMFVGGLASNALIRTSISWMSAIMVSIGLKPYYVLNELLLQTAREDV